MVIGKLRSAFGQRLKQTDEINPARQGDGKRFKRCVLHIGTVKTGTTTIQSFLTINRNSLIDRGFIYPSATGKNGGSQWGFVACADDKPWETDMGRALNILSVSDQEKYRDELRDKLLQEFDAAPSASELIISSEHFHSRLTNTDMIAALKEFLDPWVEKFEVILYLRRQDHLAVSHFSTMIKNGDTNLFHFFGAPKGLVLYHFDYKKIYDNWCLIFGEEALSIRLFSPREWAFGDLLQDFCAICGLDMNGLHIPPVENESINQLGTDFLLEVNRQLPSMINGKRNADREALLQIIFQLCRGKSYPAIRKDAVSFYNRFVDSNESLKEKAFPGRSEPLFNNDFSDYPETADQLRPRYEDAVKLAMRIWKAKT